MDDLSHQEIRSQPLFHSWQIQLMGNSLCWEAWARQGRVRLQHLRDLILSGLPHTQPALRQEVTLLLDSMPPSWAAIVCGPAPQPTHLASAAQPDSRVFCPDADSQLVHTYTVTSTAALVPAPALPEGAPLFFFLRKKPYMSAQLANCSNVNRQIQETSGIGHTQHNPPCGKLLRHGKRYICDMVIA